MIRTSYITLFPETFQRHVVFIVILITLIICQSCVAHYCDDVIGNRLPTDIFSFATTINRIMRNYSLDMKSSALIEFSNWNYIAQDWSDYSIINWPLRNKEHIILISMISTYRTNNEYSPFDLIITHWLLWYRNNDVYWQINSSVEFSYICKTYLLKFIHLNCEIMPTSQPVAEIDSRGSLSYFNY